MTVKWRHMAIVSVLVLAACGKVPNASMQRVALLFSATVETEALTKTGAGAPNKAMGATYDTRESFVVFAAYTEDVFDSSSRTDYFTASGQECSYDNVAGYWKPENSYFWPVAGYLSFQAYSPSVACEDMATFAHHWDTGFTFTDFTVRSVDNQYDLLYTTIVKDIQRYLYDENNPYDELVGDMGSYKGIDLPFCHALSLIEVQASSGLGSVSQTKYYVQKIELKEAYNTGDFSSSSGAWSGQENEVNYDVIDMGDQWKELPGNDLEGVSVNPDRVLMLLPQALDHGVSLRVTFKKGSGGSPQYADVSLTGNWEPGKKYTYKLVFSDYIEFDADIQPWGSVITGAVTITNTDD